MKLDDLAEPYAARVRGAKDAGSWEACCISARAAQWVAWNVCEDAWHTAATLLRVRAEIDAADAATPGLNGHGGPALPEILGDVTPALKMDAEVLGPVSFDWSTRPFLTGGTPL